MDDREILGRIHTLVEEEKDLLRRHEGEGLHQDDERRLKSIEESLDQCWDLLRQRRALREFGRDPNAAEPRDSEIVERYRQ